METKMNFGNFDKMSMSLCEYNDAKLPDHTKNT